MKNRRKSWKIHGLKPSFCSLQDHYIHLGDDYIRNLLTASQHRQLSTLIQACSLIPYSCLRKFENMVPQFLCCLSLWQPRLQEKSTDADQPPGYYTIQHSKMSYELQDVAPCAPTKNLPHPQEGSGASIHLKKSVVFMESLRNPYQSGTIPEGT